MMKTLILVLVTATLVLGLQGRATEPAGSAFRALHLFNVRTEVDEARLLQAVSEFNQVLAEIGHPEIRYRVWKVSGTRSGDYNYLWDSTWPNRDTYDAVHDDDKFQAVVSRHRQAITGLLKDHLYNQYVELVRE